MQARLRLGLVHLGFVVLVIDAFGASERFTARLRLSMAPSDHALAVRATLLGMQVYDNRRAVDYLCTRPEVDPRRLGVTGASGGGNQSMYAGAMDDRFQAVVPVCSVGNYQAYLRAACCVCEVLPGALRFTEEGDVLGLVAPRALMVINATRDGFQFSVEQAKRSMERAQAVFALHKESDKVRHVTFESPHAYNQPMREAMYGWMTRWLKNEGKGDPIPEPKHAIEKPEDLACFPDGKRPERFLLLPAFAERAGRELVERASKTLPDHVEDWDSTAVAKRRQLERQVFGRFPATPEPRATLEKPSTAGHVRSTPLVLTPERDMPVPAVVQEHTAKKGRQPACVLLHLGGKDQTLKHPLAAAFLERHWLLLAPDLRATGSTAPASDAIAGAPDHNSAEHGLWIGRPLLGQWVFDVACLVDWLAVQKTVDNRHISVVGIGDAGLVALCAAAALDDRIASAAAVGTLATYLTPTAYPAGTHMGVLAPGILNVGDVPQIAALSAPRRVVIAGPLGHEGKPLAEKRMREAFAFARAIYALHKMEGRLTLLETPREKEIIAGLG
ncbi:MAG: acetylxylan esterase [Gemmataceae bacterium]